MPKSIRQRATIHATPQKVYEAFMDSKLHSKFTGSPAKISTQVGGKYSAHGGYCYGVNVELVKNKKIVQTWIAQDFPKGHESRITLNLKKVPTGTQISFYHSNVPDKAVKSITDGWITYYWEPLKKMFS